MQGGSFRRWRFCDVAYFVPVHGKTTMDHPTEEMMIGKFVALAVALAASSSAFASSDCTGSFNLGSMGPPATKSFGNSFSTTTRFSDCYDFSISAPANAGGTTTERDATSTFLFWTFTWTDVEVTAVSLFNALTGTQVGQRDTTPNSFAFGNLAAGAYELVVNGSSRASLPAGWATASYSGTLTTSQIAGAVPEPEFYGMLALGLAGAGFAARRRQRRS